jgi:tetratricopeptide (TPR) repeat protein
MKTTPVTLPALVMSGLLLLGLALLAYWIFLPPAGDALTGYSPDRLYNQANAYAHSGKTGLAILNYERALLLAPADADAQANLHWVRDHAGLAQPAPSLADRLAAVASPDLLAYAGSLGLLIIGIALFASRVGPQMRWLARLGLIVGIAFLSLAAASAAMTWPKMNQAVVIADASARISPVTTGEVAFPLREGDLVTVEAEYHDFALVQTSDARRGWILSSQLSRLIPPGDNGGASANAKS